MLRRAVHRAHLRTGRKMGMHVGHARCALGFAANKSERLHRELAHRRHGCAVAALPVLTHNAALAQMRTAPQHGQPAHQLPPISII